ncbi:MAG: type I restriction enzyme HsdR N-terminal domain-containing protein [Pseudomonadota bacterium]
MTGHHLVMGTLTDYLSGELLEDTHDERYRQKLARLLVEEKGYGKSEVLSHHKLFVQAGTRKAIIRVDFLITILNKKCMLIKYAPGSIVTRRRSVLAISRLVSGFQVPIVVVTNGLDAEIVSGSTGDVMSTGLHSIPSRDELVKIRNTHPWHPVSKDRAGRESRIAYAYEVDDACPCDETICRINES